jgi:alpha-D-xyloside xylohydrolase
MKFEKGHWLLLPGVQASYPVYLVDVQIEPDSLILTGYDHQVRGRGDLLGGTTITARFTSPLPDVIRVQLTHFKGQLPQKPIFDLDYSLQNAAVCTGVDENCAWLSSGRPDGRHHEKWQMGIRISAQCPILTASGEKSIALMIKEERPICEKVFLWRLVSWSMDLGALWTIG